MEFTHWENVAENLFGQNVLDEHLPRLLRRDPPANGVLALRQEGREPLMKS